MNTSLQFIEPNDLGLGDCQSDYIMTKCRSAKIFCGHLHKILILVASMLTYILKQ